MRLARPLAGLFALAAVLVGCPADEPTPPPTPVPTTLTLNTNAVAFDALGATQQLTATVLDQDGQPMSGQTVTWVTAGGGVASVSTAGLVTAEGNGSTTVTASLGSLSADATVTVAQVPTQIAKIAGDGQSGVVGAVLAVALEIEIRDSRGNAVPGGTPNTVVTFAVASGGGSVSGTPGFADANGRATTMWTLGTGAGAQGATASIGAGSVSTQFAATGTAGPADEIVLVSGDGQSRQIGAALQDPLVVRVDDEHGNPVSGHMVTFAATTGGGSVNPAMVATGANGEASTTWTLGNTVGPQTAEAQAATAITGSPVGFLATGTNPMPATVAVFDGDGQLGLVGSPVNVPPAVLVEDQTGDPFAGATVTFMVTGGGGSLTGGAAVTDANGIARVGSWTLGGAAGANMMSATVTGMGITGNPVAFTVSGQAAAYNVEIRFATGTSPTAAQQAAFDNAEAFWEAVLFRDLADVTVNVPADACIVGQPQLMETIDDMVVFVRYATIDGASGTLAQAGRCDIAPPNPPLRGGSDSLPAIGILTMDQADLASLEANGTLEAVILHELGHTLGFSSDFFSLKGRLQNPSRPSSAGVDTHFDGPRAIQQMDIVGGSGYAGAKVPLENTAVQGQADSHWRESVFDEELMTPFVENAGGMPLSVVTAAALLDLGYGVSFAAAQAFSLGAPPLAAAAGLKIALGHDVVFSGLPPSVRIGGRR